MTHLSPHFMLEELCRSQTAARLELDNTPGPTEIEALRALCLHVLEPLRLYLAEPIVVTSGYRCERLNKAVGGVHNSAHLRGCAADLHVEGMACEDVAAAIQAAGIVFDQLIIEHVGNARWVHVSHEAPNRRQVLHIEK